MDNSGEKEFNVRINNPMKSVGIFLILIMLTQVSMATPVTVSGEMKQWHSVILTLSGPATGEQSAENPFANYRLDIVFTHETGKSYVVPGYFAADGEAANTASTTGNKWRVIFTPDQVGKWDYQVSFRKGPNVAAITYQENLQAGDKVAKLDSYKGSFNIGQSDKKGVDFRAPENGLLLFDGLGLYPNSYILGRIIKS